MTFGHTNERLGGMCVLVLAVFALGMGEFAHAQTATYRVTFQGKWTIASTPGGVDRSAHFTTLIGAVHNGNVSFWQSGGVASPGIEEVAETGRTRSFRDAIERNPHVFAVIQRGVSFGGTGRATFDLRVPADHPLITLVSMIGPSPDWFVGVSGLSLLDGEGQWMSERQVDLFPCDAGTEDGTEFSLSNPPTNPRGTITSIRGTGKFSDERMAMLIFHLQATDPQLGRVTGVTVTPGVETLVVSWNAVTGATGYKVQWKSGNEAFGAERERVVVDGATTSHTIANLTTGTLYSVRVIATRSPAHEGPPSAVVSGTPLSAPPPSELLTGGDTAIIDLSSLCSNARDEPLTYAAESSDPMLVTVTLDGSKLSIVSNEDGKEGTATVTVTATDVDGVTMQRSFDVTVEPTVPGILRGWRKAVFDREEAESR